MHLCQMATLTLQVLGTTSWTRQQHVNGFRSCVASLVGHERSSFHKETILNP
jgi:hypothetical protein